MINVDTSVALYNCRHEKWSSVVVQLYYCPFPRSSKKKHPKPSNISKLVFAPGFYSLCNDLSFE